MVILSTYPGGFEAAVTIAGPAGQAQMAVVPVHQRKGHALAHETGGIA